MPWRDQLRRVVGQHGEGGRPRNPKKEDVLRFLRETVAPALHSVADEMASHEREAEVEVEEDQVSITIFHQDEEEFYYAVKARTFRKPSFAFPEMTFKEDGKDLYHRAMVYTRAGSRDYGIMGHGPEQVIGNFMQEYDRQLRWQKPTKRGREGPAT